MQALKSHKTPKSTTTATAATQPTFFNQNTAANPQKQAPSSFFLPQLLKIDPKKIADKNLITLAKDIVKQGGIDEVNTEPAMLEYQRKVIAAFSQRPIISLRDFDAKTLKEIEPAFNKYRPNDVDTIRRLITYENNPPVLWGMNTTRKQFYGSVIAPSLSLKELSIYLYGSTDHTVGYADENGNPLPSQMFAGQTITFTITHKTTTSISLKHRLDGLKEGNLIRSADYMASQAGSEEQYLFTLKGQEMRLNQAQFRGLLEGRKTWLRRSLKSSFSTARIYFETQVDHVKGSNSLIRGISDFAGDADLPSYDVYLNPMIEINKILVALASIGSDKPVLDNARTLSQLYNRNAEIASDVRKAAYAWDKYIQATINGASGMVTALEVTRNVSFAVAAGLAAATVAPAVFVAAAGKGTAVAGGAALAAGTVTGGVTKAGLELSSSVAGEGIAMAVTPGDQDFDTSYVAGRTASGFKSGLVDGAMGAASFFQGAYVASKFAPAFAATRTGQVTIGAVSGGTSELAMATGQELISPGPDGFSGMNVLKRTFYGTLLGGATSVLPINGLYRSKPNGGVSFVPFKGGTPVTPEWMMASPWTFVQPKGRANPDLSLTPRGTDNYRQAINSLPAEQLPVLPKEYSWARVNGNEWAIVRPPNMPDIDIHTWPAPEGGFHFAVRRQNPNGGRSEMLYSSAKARGNTPNRPSTDRSDPFPTSEYRDVDTGTTMDRGHGGDHADTHRPAHGPDATSDPANFSPQTKGWNQFERRTLVGRIRKGRNPVDPDQALSLGPNATYKEVSYYGPNPGRTQSGEAIPDGVYFIVGNSSGVPQMAFRVPRNYNRISGPGSTTPNLRALQVPVADVPVGLIGKGNFTPIKNAGITTGLSETK